MDKEVRRIDRKKLKTQARQTKVGKIAAALGLGLGLGGDNSVASTPQAQGTPRLHLNGGYQEGGVADDNRSVSSKASSHGSSRRERLEESREAKRSKKSEASVMSADVRDDVESVELD